MAGMEGGSAKTCGALKRGRLGAHVCRQGFRCQDFQDCIIIITLILGAKRLKIHRMNQKGRHLTGKAPEIQICTAHFLSCRSLQASCRSVSSFISPHPFVPFLRPCELPERTLWMTSFIPGCPPSRSTSPPPLSFPSAAS